MAGRSAVVLAAGLPASVTTGVRDAVPAAGVTFRTCDADAVDRDAVLGVDCVVLGDDDGTVDAVDRLSTIRDVRPDVPVVLVPTDPTHRVATDAVAHDVDAYLPVETVDETPEKLADAVAEATTLPDDAAAPGTGGGQGTGDDAAATADGGRTTAPIPTADDPFDHRPGVPQLARGLEDAAPVANRLVELAPDAMFVADLETRAVLDVNQAAADVLGYAPETLRGVHVTELHPGDPADLMTQVDGVLDDGDAAVEPRFDALDGLEFRTRRGETVPVALRADTVTVDDRTLVVAVFRDVSDERDRIEALERTERRLRNVTEAAFDIVFRVDANGVFESVSGTVEAVLGYEPVDLVDEPFSTVIADEDADRAFDAFARARDGERVSELQLTVVAADQRRRHIEVNIVPVVVDGDVRGLEGAARDVTRQYQRERLLSVLNRVLRHNVRNAATVLTGHGDALADATLDTSVETHVDAIKETSADLVALGEKSARLRRAARNQDGRTDTDAATAVRSAVARFELAPEILSVDGTAVVNVGGELEFAVHELLANAIEHGGDVTTVAVDELDGFVTVTVADDGDGFPEQDRRVLEGAEESPLEHGSGLGLWLVNWITSTGGGEVTVDTGEHGTRVELRLAKAAR
ncbi:PAS domain S-box protein [Halorubellus salinus]|uniref:PAS domain S-box protein n=1 Tax=Halorubellus salinus TaxID=755309 RepID=UPI001D08E867|nr:PAS domain-containing sensor histidine kinase [Halorubellus salinus]